MEKRILFVDDEPKILEAYRRTLRKSFSIVSAGSGAEALDIMASQGPFSIIVSDMQMPEMNGTQLLSQVKAKYPHTVRMMLTGNADQQTAVDAINTADVYRFINKPCPAVDMIAALEAGLHHAELFRAEQKLLENTVKGSINALVAILSLVSPKVFGRAATTRNYMLKCAKELGLKSTWELEATALLSQIGLVTQPDSILEQMLKGDQLSEKHQGIYDKHSEAGAKLINKIPRLESIAEAIRFQNKSFDGSGLPAGNVSGTDIPLGGRLLKPLLDLVAKESRGLSSTDAVSQMKSQGSCYDPQILEIIERVIESDGDLETKEISVTQLAADMVIAKDLYTASGVLLIGKGQVISSPLIERLINFWKNNEIPEKISVLYKK